MTGIYIIGIILILGILILVHEMGHLLAAKSVGVPVKVFSIGFPMGNLIPPLRLFKWGETEFQLNILFLGGFCAFMDDENKEAEVSSDDKNYLRNRPPLERLWVISAGVISNAIFSYIVLVVMVFALGVSSFYPKDGVKVIEYPAHESPAYQSGIRAGDTIVSVGDVMLNRTKDKEATELLKEEITKHKGIPTKISVKRGNKILNLKVTPSQTGLIGVKITSDVKELRRPIQNIAEPFVIGGTTFANMTVRLVDSLVQLVSGKIALSQVGGPIAVGKVGVEIAQNDPTQLFLFAALIGIELVILNLLPIPALDGGHIFFIFIELIRRKPLPKRLEENLLYTGFILLMGLGLLLIVKDLYTSFTGG